MGYLDGFGVTLRKMVGVHTDTGRRVTTEYPEEVRPKPERFHGRHVLNRYEDGMEKCIGCELCAGVCPARCIYVRGQDNDPEAPTSPGERFGYVYEINYLRCIHCDLCVEACPTEAITETKLFEFAFSNRSDAIYTKDELLVDDEGQPRRQTWENWDGGFDPAAQTSGWMRATAAGGDADFIGLVAWAGELGYGVRPAEREPEPPAPEDDGHDDHGHDGHGHDGHDGHDGGAHGGDGPHGQDLEADPLGAPHDSPQRGVFDHAGPASARPTRAGDDEDDASVLARLAVDEDASVDLEASTADTATPGTGAAGAASDSDAGDGGAGHFDYSGDGPTRQRAAATEPVADPEASAADEPSQEDEPQASTEVSAAADDTAVGDTTPAESAEDDAPMRGLFDAPDAEPDATKPGRGRRRRKGDRR